MSSAHLLNSIRNFFALPVILSRMAKGLIRQHFFMKKTVLPELDAIRKENDGSLTDNDFRKITHYYAFAVPAVLGESYSMLSGKKLTQAERMALTYQGALTGLFDDFFDKKQTDQEHILRMMLQADDQLANNTHELLFMRFCRKAVANAAHKQRLQAVANEVFQAQILSLSQQQSNLSTEEISALTQKKGGLSLLFYRIVLQRIPTKEEEEMTFLLGGLLQLENDIFDIYKDRQAHIDTLATTLTSIVELRKYYYRQISETIRAVHQTPYPLKNKLRFIRFIMLIVVRGLVCLDCLEQNEKATDGVFRLEAYTRKMLICDMEKVRNSWATLMFYLKLDYRSDSFQDDK